MKFSRIALAALVGVSVLGTVGAHASEKDVKKTIGKKASLLSTMHKKASKALVNSAQDKVFGEYFGGNTALKPEIDKLALSVQSKFHVAEMCLINDQGHEISRIVADQVAPAEDLSTEEASADFFKPSFAKPAKQVFVSPIYMSPDANKWVVAYVTPIEVGGKKAAILHYEHGLETFQEVLSKDLEGDSYALLISQEGYVIGDSRSAIDVMKKGESEVQADYFKKLEGAIAGAVKLGEDGEASFDEGGKAMTVAFKPVENWTLVVAGSK